MNATSAAYVLLLGTAAMLPLTAAAVLGALPWPPAGAKAPVPAAWVPR